ncbi:hypothetical protein EV176_005980, partial [Coemansia sp. RSA 451]
MIKCPQCVKSFKSDRVLKAHTNVWHYTRSRKAMIAKRQAGQSELRLGMEPAAVSTSHLRDLVRSHGASGHSHEGKESSPPPPPVPQLHLDRVPSHCSTQ